MSKYSATIYLVKDNAEINTKSLDKFNTLERGSIVLKNFVKKEGNYGLYHHSSCRETAAINTFNNVKCIHELAPTYPVYIKMESTYTSSESFDSIKQFVIAMLSKLCDIKSLVDITVNNEKVSFIMKYDFENMSYSRVSYSMSTIFFLLRERELLDKLIKLGIKDALTFENISKGIIRYITNDTYVPVEGYKNSTGSDVFAIFLISQYVHYLSTNCSSLSIDGPIEHSGPVEYMESLSLRKAFSCFYNSVFSDGDKDRFEKIKKIILAGKKNIYNTYAVMLSTALNGGLF